MHINQDIEVAVKDMRTGNVYAYSIRPNDFTVIRVTDVRSTEMYGQIEWIADIESYVRYSDGSYHPFNVSADDKDFINHLDSWYSHGIALEMPLIIDTAEPIEVEADEDEDNTFTCADCGDKKDADEYVRDNSDGERICESCSENYSSCERCGDTELLDNLSSFQHEMYCDHCLDEVSFECYDCNRRAGADIVYRDNRHNSICERCYENNYFTCDNCNEICHTEDYGSEGNCTNCETSEDNAGELIHKYGHKPTPIMHGTGTRYGIELEVNTDSERDHAEYALETLNGTVSESVYEQRHAYLKEDGSLTDGFEIVTHPHSLLEQRKLWAKFFQDVPNGMTSYKSGQCGMHVHIERAKLSEMQIRRMLVFLNHADSRQYVCAIAQRSASTYAKLMEKEITSRFSSDRYEALNLTNSKTVELRIFRGTVRADRFFKNLEFTDALVQFTRETVYSKLTVKNFLSFVTKRRSQYKHLYNFHVEKSFISGKMLPVANTPQRKLFEAVAVDSAA